MAYPPRVCLLEILLVILTTFNVVFSNTRLELSASSETVHIGDTWTLTCMVSQDNQDSVMVKIFKRVGSVEYEVALNTFIDQTFKDTGRYSQVLQLLNTTMNSPREFTLTLQITNVQPSDSGEIGCAILSENLEASNKLVVYNPVEDIKLTMGDPGGDEFKYTADGQTLEFPEGTIQTVMCRVRGGYPAPKVEMSSKDLYITDKFDLEQDLVSNAEDPSGLQVLNYRTSLLKEDFNVSYAYHDKMLSCSANVPGSGFDQVSREFKIRLLQYSPKFDCGAYRPTAVIGKPYSISCIVSASPPIFDVHVFWDDDDKPRKGEAGHYKADVQPMDDLEKTTVTLKIDKVHKNNLRDYIFEAENDLGKTREIVSIHARPGKKDRNIAAAAPNWEISPSLVLLLVAIVTKLIEQ